MEALVFDFDGVIVDSEHLHDQALREVCRPLGFEWSGEPWVGWPDAEVLIELHRRRGEALAHTRLAELLAKKTEAVVRQVEAGLYRPYAGSLELMRSGAAHTRIAVCSAGLRGQIVPVLESFGVMPLVTALVAYEDSARSKPDPAPYLLAAERLGARPARSVAIEDSPRGVASARGAGFRVVAVGHTSARDDLRDAHMHVHAINELSIDVLSTIIEPH